MCASSRVMLADLYSPGPNTTDLQGQWIDATTSPPGGPPVYGTPGPSDDVDLEGVDITASGGSVRRIYNLGSLTVTGMASAIEASAFTLRGSGTLNVTDVDPNNGLAVVGGHLKASGPADFVDVSSGGVVTAGSCKGGSFKGGSSLTIEGTGFPGSTANFFSGSSLTAMEGLRNFSFTLHSGSLAHVLSYQLENGFAAISDPGSAFSVEQDCEIDDGGSFSIGAGGSANVAGNLIADGGGISIDQSGSVLTANGDLVIMAGDLQISDGGNASVAGALQMPHGHIGVHDARSELTLSGPSTIGGAGSPAAIIDVVNQGAIQDSGDIDLLSDGVINVQDGRPVTGHSDFDLSAALLSVKGGTLNVTMGGRVLLNKTFVLLRGSNDQPTTATISGGELDVNYSAVSDKCTIDITDGGRVTGTSPGRTMTIFGKVSVSGAGSLLSFSDVALTEVSSGATLFATDNGFIEIATSLFVSDGSGVTAASGGRIAIGGTGSAADEVVVGEGGSLQDNGAVTCGEARIIPGGILSGAGTINGKLFSSGWIFPGNSPGMLTVQGDYTQNSDGLLDIEIGGADPGSGYDQFQISGAASLAGNLQVRLVKGFTPTIGQTFRIVNAGSMAGAFSSISQPSQAGVSVSNDAGGVTLTVTSVVAGAPVISSATTISATQGNAFSYQITATNNPSSFDAMNLPDGLTVNPSSGVISGAPTKSGSYVVPMTANNTAGVGLAELIIQVSLPSGQPSQLLNISTRMEVQTGNNVVIGGFIVTGTNPKQVLVRGLGPSLPVSGALADPTLELHDASKTLATDDDWKDSQQTEIEATGIPPTKESEAAIVATLPAGNASYTAILAGKNGGTGVGLVEVYDLAQSANSKLANISTRGFVDRGDNAMIGGFITEGVMRVLVRAIGPSLANSGVQGALQDPTVELHDGSGNTIASNDNWKMRPDGSSQQEEIEATTIPPPNELEAALVATLPPGAYTAVVRGKNDTTGIGLVEVYSLRAP